MNETQPEQSSIEVVEDNEVRVINVAEDFYPYPGGRYLEDGKGNATEFREEHLVPILNKNMRAKIILDGVGGYAASFLEEAFGGLVSKHNYTPEKILESFEFVADKPGFAVVVPIIKRCINNAKGKGY